MELAVIPYRMGSMESGVVGVVVLLMLQSFRCSNARGSIAVAAMCTYLSPLDLYASLDTD